eukprot:TRINITY_DN5739_c0_g1_i1.p1 TRINITY_DN5739_c0_g1~~TRINITY_DN5739_c0_g1_i1.p1  ORF type:complete len:770 (+),score=85.32 TRINITY_DN5739_c0_g1_i1:90-2312(+)
METSEVDRPEESDSDPPSLDLPPVMINGKPHNDPNPIPIQFRGETSVPIEFQFNIPGAKNISAKPEFLVDVGTNRITPPTLKISHLRPELAKRQPYLFAIRTEDNIVLAKLQENNGKRGGGGKGAGAIFRFEIGPYVFVSSKIPYKQITTNKRKKGSDELPNSKKAKAGDGQGCPPPSTYPQTPLLQPADPPQSGYPPKSSPANSFLSQQPDASQESNYPSQQLVHFPQALYGDGVPAVLDPLFTEPVQVQTLSYGASFSLSPPGNYYDRGDFAAPSVGFDSPTPSSQSIPLLAPLDQFLDSDIKFIAGGVKDIPAAGQHVLMKFGRELYSHPKFTFFNPFAPSVFSIPLVAPPQDGTFSFWIPPGKPGQEGLLTIVCGNSVLCKHWYCYYEPPPAPLAPTYEVSTNDQNDSSTSSNPHHQQSHGVSSEPNNFLNSEDQDRTLEPQTESADLIFKFESFLQVRFGRKMFASNLQNFYGLFRQFNQTSMTLSMFREWLSLRRGRSIRYPIIFSKKRFALWRAPDTEDVFEQLKRTIFDVEESPPPETFAETEVAPDLVWLQTESYSTENKPNQAEALIVAELVDKLLKIDAAALISLICGPVQKAAITETLDQFSAAGSGIDQTRLNFSTVDSANAVEKCDFAIFADVTPPKDASHFVEILSKPKRCYFVGDARPFFAAPPTTFWRELIRYKVGAAQFHEPIRYLHDPSVFAQFPSGRELPRLQPESKSAERGLGCDTASL